MDQQKRGQQSHETQKDRSRSPNDEQMHGDPSHQNREPAEGSRDSVNTERNVNTGRNKRQRGGGRSPGGDNERGMGSSGERNSGGISNRGMDPSMEQRDLPSRGSTRESER